MPILLLILFAISSVHAHDIKNLFFQKEICYKVDEPFRADYLTVDEIHRIYFEEYGNPQGVPVLILHGGPGGGCKKVMAKYFDPTFYRIIMFDQRGCNRSAPYACLTNNTPQHSVHDIEILRNHLDIDTWIVTGGSYGTLLALLYAQTHPGHVTHLVLRGIFLGRKNDYENILWNMSKFFPEAYAELLDLFTEDEKKDFLHAFDKRITVDDVSLVQPFAQAFMYYDYLCSELNPNFEAVRSELVPRLTLTVTRFFVHYAAHGFFLEDDQILKNCHHIAHIPTYIIHGRYDLVCPAQNAYDLWQKLPQSELWYIMNAGHASCEPGISQALCICMDQIKETMSIKGIQGAV